jgi:hypothetical protein
MLPGFAIPPGSLRLAICLRRSSTRFAPVPAWPTSAISPVPEPSSMLGALSQPDLGWWLHFEWKLVHQRCRGTQYRWLGQSHSPTPDPARTGLIQVTR